MGIIASINAGKTVEFFPNVSKRDARFLISWWSVKRPDWLFTKKVSMRAGKRILYTIYVQKAKV